MALVTHVLKKVKIVKINLYKGAINLPWGHVVIDVIWDTNEKIYIYR